LKHNRGNRPPAAPGAHYNQQSPAGCAGGPFHSAIARRLRQRPITFNKTSGPEKILFGPEVFLVFFCALDCGQGLRPAA